MPAVTATAWTDEASALCRRCIEEDPINSTSADAVNALLSALIGLAGFSGCPQEYREQTANLRADGRWARCAEATHRRLAELVDQANADGAQLADDVNDYYQTREVDR